MLRFPATQGTILVQCPVCSHRFTFVPDQENSEDFHRSEQVPSFQFQPSFQSYKELFLDLLYAPIDYLKSKQGPKRREIRLIPILLFTILMLYFWKWSSFPNTPKPDASVEEKLPNPMIEEPNQELVPPDSTEDLQPETKPGYEI
ncbi:hypothetical protein EHQ68_04095 [Leptospira congkakensis]|uniref:Uncharacterized protein n=2 Tax=Leptospira congkakensis TaxID=2484932 RepID=A0A4Z1AN19_9LEPT|nr:hypothetical protein [Leptospira congkakensis]TGL90616.1 hypothetical protein EHQ69_11855 [Leptospira congkakensis]TGL91623.1 hypothetical protein EHQ68_04095 [Leptospira congkakensis]TGL99067.1 hypothetical protein EHQ70_03680 [Leptospira congkakensis]